MVHRISTSREVEWIEMAEHKSGYTQDIYWQRVLYHSVLLLDNKEAAKKYLKKWQDLDTAWEEAAKEYLKKWQDLEGS